MPSTTPIPSPTRSETVRALSRHERVALANDLRIACMRIARRVRTESDSELASHQFSALIRLEGGPRTNSEIAEIEQVSAPSMCRTTQGMVNLGLIARSDNPADGRQVILSLTSEGRETIKRVRRHRDEWMLDRLDGLTHDERDLLHRAALVLAKVASK